MGKSSDAPAPPDYTSAAVAQGAANAEAARISGKISNPNVNTPYGNQSVSWGMNSDGTPNDQATINQTLNPESQKIFDAQQQTRLGLAGISNQALGTAQGVLGSQFNFNGPNVQTSLSGYGAVPGQNQYGNIQQGVSAPNLQSQVNTSGVAAMPVNAGTTGQQAIMARLQPQIAQQNAASDNQMANQGIVQGSEAYNNAMRVRNQGNNDLISNAALQGINLDMNANNQGYNQALQSGNFANQSALSGFDTRMQNANLNNSGQNQGYSQALSGQNQQFNQGLAGAQFGNTAQQQSLQQQLSQRELPLNEISALMSGSQIQNPQFQGYTGQQVQAAPTFNATQAQGNAALQGYGTQSANNNAFNSGLMSSAALAAMYFSDRRLKSNIVRVGTHPLGIGIYEYDIFGRRECGAMADEVLAVKPEAVAMHQSGYMMVDYGRL